MLLNRIDGFKMFTESYVSKLNSHKDVNITSTLKPKYLQIKGEKYTGKTKLAGNLLLMFHF